MLCLKPRTSLTQHHGSSQHSSPCPYPKPFLPRDWASASILPAQSLFNSAILATSVSWSLSPGGLFWSEAPVLLSLIPLLSLSGLVCHLCSAWTPHSACFLPYIYSKNLLHALGVVMSSSFCFIFFHSSGPETTGVA